VKKKEAREMGFTLQGRFEVRGNFKVDHTSEGGGQELPQLKSPSRRGRSLISNAPKGVKENAGSA